MSTFSESSFRSSDGAHFCHFVTARPDAAPRAVIQISHGVCEHIGRYREFMQLMADKGFVVCGNDHLGHGKTVYSDEELGYFAPADGWQCAVKDLHRLTKIMKKEYPDLPYFMLGHSMGSFFARAYAVKFPDECTGFLLLGTADGFETNVASAADKGLKIVNKLAGANIERKPQAEEKIGGAALTFLLGQGEILKKLKGERYRSSALYKIAFGRNNDRISPKRTDYDWLSRDYAQIDEYTSDSLCTFTLTVNGFINLASALKYVSDDRWFSHLRKDIPVLLLSGDCDPIGNYGEGVKSVYERMKAYRCNVQMKLYEGARHELIHELNRAEVCGDIIEFVENNLKQG